ncbi:MAG: hypothetical protein K0S61_3948 [Anaerocolumna sp.]|jgi:hypothetical protein|nr:hypothetical protein [Anaerocolumna sp.]
MIHHLKEQIKDKLQELYSECTIYDEDLPTIYEKPAILVNVISHSVSSGLAGKQKNQINFDVSYYAGSNDAIKSECFIAGSKLIEEFHLTDYQIRNKKAQTTDNVMHFTFDTQYITKELKTETIMEKQQIKINL